MKRKFLFPSKNIPPSKISLVVDNDEFETIIVKKEINFQDKNTNKMYDVLNIYENLQRTHNLIFFLYLLEFMKVQIGLLVIIIKSLAIIINISCF